MLNLDTHVLLHALAGSLERSEKTLLSRNPWSISAIVLWEIAKLVQLKRVDVDLDSPEVVRTLKSIKVWPLDLEVARASTRLDFKGDPADELIAATSVVHNVPLVTRDRAIRRSRRVPLAGR
ncbi:MAG: type II toxin-antitoxin system VapC family toxin [bacterium]|nr:type II toxin-antitoxin system VapC family toxin [bacterium]